MPPSKQERENIYIEEKTKRECRCGTPGILLLVTIGALAGLVALIATSLRQPGRVSIEALRKAYSGLDTDEE